MGISWGKSERIKFEGAFKLDQWTPPAVPGIYAITCKEDPVNKPRNHTVLYFGEGGDLADQGLPFNHDDSDLWIHSAGDKTELYIFVCPMLGATSTERWRLHERLVTEYNPPCNRRR